MNSNNYESIFFDKSDDELHKIIYSREYSDRGFIEAALNEQRYRNAIKSMKNFNSFLDPEILKLLKRENIFPVAVNRKIWEEAIRRNLIERKSYDEDRYRNSTRSDDTRRNTTNTHNSNDYTIRENTNSNTVRNDDGRNIPPQRFNNYNDQGYEESPYPNSVRNNRINTSNNHYDDQDYHDPNGNTTPKTEQRRINSINYNAISDQGISLNKSHIIKMGGLMALVGFLFMPVAGCGGMTVTGYDLMGMKDISDTVKLLAGLAMVFALIIIFAKHKVITFFCSIGGLASLIIAFLIITKKTNSADNFGISSSIEIKSGSYISMLGFIISGFLSRIRINIEPERKQTEPQRNNYYRDNRDLPDRNSNSHTDLRNIPTPTYNRNNDNNVSYRNTSIYSAPRKHNVNSKRNEIKVVRIPKYLIILAILFLIFSIIMIIKPTNITHFIKQKEAEISARKSANREVYLGNWRNTQINRELIITPNGTSNYFVTLRLPSELPGVMNTVEWSKFSYKNGSIVLGESVISYSNGKITYDGEEYEKIEDKTIISNTENESTSKDNVAINNQESQPLTEVVENTTSKIQENSSDSKVMKMIFKAYKTGDNVYLVFEDIATGKEYSFQNQDESKFNGIKILIDDKTAEFGERANPKYLNKKFIVEAVYKTVLTNGPGLETIKMKSWVINNLTESD